MDIKAKNEFTKDFIFKLNKSYNKRAIFCEYDNEVNSHFPDCGILINNCDVVIMSWACEQWCKLKHVKYFKYHNKLLFNILQI